MEDGRQIRGKASPYLQYPLKLEGFLLNLSPSPFPSLGFASTLVGSK